MTEGAIVENQPERVEAFTEEIESLKLKASSAESERGCCCSARSLLVGGWRCRSSERIQVTDEPVASRPAGLHGDRARSSGSR